MPNRITFQHEVLSSGQHAIFSPDIQGFCIVGAPGESLNDVQRQAIDALNLLQSRRPNGSQGRLAAIEYEAA